VKISLDRVDARSLAVGLAGEGERIVLAEVDGLHGTLETEADLVSLSGVTAERLLVEALRVALGSLILTATGATVTSVGLAMQRRSPQMVLAVSTAEVAATELGVEVGSVAVQGACKLSGLRLATRNDDGELSAETVEIAPISLRIGGVTLAAPSLSATGVVLKWGSVFRMAAKAIAAPSLTVSLADIGIGGSDVSVNDFFLEGDRITFSRASVGKGEVTLALARESTPSRASAEKPPPLLDLATMDALSGELDVDVDVDVTVPIIGSRKATHRFRIPIDTGTIDFMAVESNLSTLENAVLDFAVRDEGLALERVNPLFPARGHGKPIVTWELSPDDMELARRDRVRLSVLADARLAGGESSEGSESSIALRALSLLRLDVRLTLTPVEPAGGQLRLRNVGALTLQGNVFYDKRQAPREGIVQGELTALAASLSALRAGKSRIDVAKVELSALRQLELRFLDVKLASVRFALDGLLLENGAVTTASTE
jgi:hypothetical protein